MGMMRCFVSGVFGGGWRGLFEGGFDNDRCWTKGRWSFRASRGYFEYIHVFALSHVTGLTVRATVIAVGC